MTAKATRRIVVLDGYALNPGDLSWEGIERLGSLEVYDRTPPDQIIERARGAVAVLTNKTPFKRETLAALPGLAYVGVLATGYNIVDTAAARELGIAVTNVPAYSTDSVAQLVFALLLEHCSHAGAHSDAVRAGQWAQSRDFAFWNFPLVELAGKTMGIVGFGQIGRKVASLAAAFGMDVLVHSRTRFVDHDGGARWTDLNTLLRESDVVSLHCPLTPETRGLINKASLALMKPTAILINTSRGPVIDQQALADALNEGRIAGAGVDVLSEEPPKADNPLLTAKNCIITPHIAWATKEARVRLMAVATANLESFFSGKPVNVVN